MNLEINQLVDIVFKKLFASPEHGVVTMSFVNALLERAGLPGREVRRAASARYIQQANHESTIASYIKTGFIEGLEQGKRQGIEQGIDQGAVAKAREIASRMKALGLAPEAIAEATGLSLAEIAGIV